MRLAEVNLGHAEGLAPAFSHALFGRRQAPRRPSLLVVDDEPLVGRTVAHAAEECGCRTRLAITAAAFRAQYEVEQPDVVLLDLSLPGGDGVELLRFLAERRSRAVVFIVSGCDGRVLEAAGRLGEALGLKMGETLTKPLLVSDLEQAMARALRTAASEGGIGHGSGICLGA